MDVLQDDVEALLRMVEHSSIVVSRDQMLSEQVCWKTCFADFTFGVITFPLPFELRRC